MYLNEIAENGAPSYRCKVRKNDELQNVVISLNEAVEALVAGKGIVRADDENTTDEGAAEDDRQAA